MADPRTKRLFRNFSRDDDRNTRCLEFSACFWQETSPVDGLCCVNVDGVQCISEYQWGACQSSNGQGSLGTQRTGPFHTEDRRRPRPYGSATSGPGPGRRVMHHRTRRHRHHQQEPARLDDRTARRCDLLHEQASYDLARLRTNGLDHPHSRQEPLSAAASIPPNPAAARSITAGSGPARPGLRVPVHICGRRPQRAGPPRRRLVFVE